MGDCFLTLFYRNRRSYIDCISYRCQANGFSGFAKYAADCVRIKRRTGINGSMENVWTADSQAKSVIRVMMYDYR